MGFINKYPYTDFHELNLDWFLEEFKKVTDKVTNLDTTVQQFTEFVTNYFDNLDVQNEVNAALQRMAENGTLTMLLQPMVDAYAETFDDRLATQDADIDVLVSRMDEFASLPPGSTAGNAELLDIRIEYDGTTAASAGDAVREQISELRDDLDAYVDNQNRLSRYFYKADTYLNGSTETTLNGYDLYRIPVTENDLIVMTWTPGTPFYGSMSDNNVLKYHGTGNIYTVLYMATPSAGYDFNKATGDALFLVQANTDYLYFSVMQGRENTLNISVNTPYVNIVAEQIVTKARFPQEIDETNACKTRCYAATNDTISPLSGSFYAFNIAVKTGDKLKFAGTIPGLGVNRGSFKEYGQAAVYMSSDSYTVPADGIISVFSLSGYDRNATLTPIESQPVAWSQLIDEPQNLKPFDGLTGVAFGTSLTYNSNTTGGYLTELQNISGITFDNQGIGSATIMNQILTKVKTYTGYAGKRVAILEGFVNDWYTNNPLGSYTDTSETSVCGCVRSAINYMLSQNPNMTIFVVLDHYGQTSCASTATNSNALTQYQYYEEIAKVAESLAIPVIKEYAVSQICENTPQYLLDNIHCNTLGAVQSGRAIYSRMQGFYPNAQ